MLHEEQYRYQLKYRQFRQKSIFLSSFLNTLLDVSQA